MKKIGKWRTIIVLVAAFSLAACASGKKQYDTGMQLKKEGNYREAIAYLEEAIAAEPNNENYQQALKELKNALIKELVAEGDDALRSATPTNLDAISRAKAKLSEAEQIDPAHPAVVEFTARFQKEEQTLLKAVQGYYIQAGKDIDSGRWLEAYLNLQQIQGLFPNYEASIEMMQQVSNQGAQALYEKGKSDFDQENYQAATEYLRQALTLNPGHSPSKKLLEEASARDRKEYFVDQAEKEVLAQNWKRAIERYEKAQTYDPADETMKQAVINVKTKAAFYFIREARSHLYAGWIGRAFETYDLAVKYASDSGQPEFAGYLEALATELSAKAAAAAEGFAAQGNYGSAWFWYQKTKAIDANYPEISYRLQAMEEEVLLRVRRSIAVFDFAPPSNAPDAGAILANNLSMFLFKTAGKDIKILERENLKSILNEMRLDQLAGVTSNIAKEMGRVYGIDVAVMGSILRYHVDATSYSDTKSVTYQVKKTEENIEYLNWKARNPNPTREELAQAPTPYIYKMQDVEKEYNVSTHKKVAFVTVSFHIVDLRTGENILVDTIARNKTATDESSAGMQVAGIKYDPLEIPTDTEMLQELTDEVVSELGREALRPLKNLEKTYYDIGEALLRGRDEIQATEYFVDSIFNQKLKSLPDSTLTSNSRKNLEDIFRNYKIQFAQ